MTSSDQFEKLTASSGSFSYDHNRHDTRTSLHIYLSIYLSIYVFVRVWGVPTPKLLFECGAWTGRSYTQCRLVSSVNTILCHCFSRCSSGFTDLLFMGFLLLFASTPDNFHDDHLSHELIKKRVYIKFFLLLVKTVAEIVEELFAKIHVYEWYSRFNGNEKSVRDQRLSSWPKWWKNLKVWKEKVILVITQFTFSFHLFAALHRF